MLSHSGILLFSTSIRRLTRNEAIWVGNHEDRELVSSVSSPHKGSRFDHHSRLMDTQSPDPVITVLCFEALTKWKVMLLSSRSSFQYLPFDFQTSYGPVSRYPRYLVRVGSPLQVDSPHWLRKCPPLLGFNFFEYPASRLDHTTKMHTAI